MNKHKNIYLGIDGGGTKTDMVLADENEKVIASVKVAQTNLYNATDVEIRKTFREGLRRLYKKARLAPDTKLYGVGVGLAGLDSPSLKRRANKLVRDSFGKKLPSSKKVHVVNDTVIGFWSGCDCGHGIGIVGGTGSNCYGVTASGKEAWASGLGHILADEGGGYYIGMRALKAAVQSADGRGAKSKLEKIILKYYKIKSVRELISVVYKPGYAKKDIAQLAFLVQEAAENGDKIAKQISKDAADELVRMIKAVTGRLNFKPSKKFELVMIGGVLQHDPILHRRFKVEVKKLFKFVKFTVPQVKPVIGAIRLAKSKK